MRTAPYRFDYVKRFEPPAPPSVVEVAVTVVCSIAVAGALALLALVASS